MQTDRELLELAAKAAGMRIEGDADSLVIQPGHFAGGFSVFNDKGGSQLWNPLTDDGDALRLAVKLGILILTARGFSVGNSTDSGPSGCVVRIAITDGTDPYAATRRAITRAAAALGEKK